MLSNHPHGCGENTLTDPYEVWLAFERHKGTGQIVLRQRVVKAVQLKKQRGPLAVFQARNGIMESWTMLPTSDRGYLNNQRVGKLAWARSK